MTLHFTRRGLWEHPFQGRPRVNPTVNLTNLEWTSNGTQLTVPVRLLRGDTTRAPTRPTTTRPRTMTRPTTRAPGPSPSRPQRPRPCRRRALDDCAVLNVLALADVELGAAPAHVVADEAVVEADGRSQWAAVALGRAWPCGSLAASKAMAFTRLHERREREGESSGQDAERELKLMAAASDTPLRHKMRVGY